MKKLSFFIVMFFISLTIGCSNIQSSKKEEALYVVEHSEDFQEIIQYISFHATGAFPDDPRIYQSDPKFESSFQFIHQIIYKTKNKEFKLAFLSDDSPPKIIKTIIIK